MLSTRTDVRRAVAAGHMPWSESKGHCYAPLARNIQIINAMVWEESVRRTIAVTIAATVFTTAAVAQNRPSTTAMTCQQAASLVYARGAIVLGTGGYTYDRFVRDRSFCQVTEALESAWVPTRDTPTCFVGYRCYEPSRDDLFEKW